jgi:hypothetical protein
MDKIRLLLTLITIAITLGPIAGIVIMYQNNLLELFIPPEINEIANNLMSGGGTNGTRLEPPTIVGLPQYDEASRTVTLTFQYKNTFTFDITVNSMSGSIVCDAHNFPLGKATLDKPVSIRAGETATITVLGTWTEEAISHFQTAHAGEKSIDIALVDLAVDIQGITIQTNQRITIPDVPIA